MIKQAKTSPDVDNYLCYLTTSATDSQRVGLTNEDLHSARSAAGIMLKNDIKTNYKSMQDSTRSYIQSKVLCGLNDANAQIRNYAGIVIAELVRQAGIMGWPGFLPNLLSLITNENSQSSLHTQEGASSALLKVCEDNRKSLSRSYQSQCPLDILVPRLLELTSHPSTKVKANALSSLDIFIPEKNEQVMRNLDTLLSRLFDLANDQHDDVRKQICRSVLHIAEVSPGRIAPHMNGLVDYMITQQQSLDDLELPLAAADFFLYISEDKLLQQALEPSLPKLVPVLLECMIYQEEDVLRLEDEAEDAEQEDREQDIKPQFAPAKAGRNAESTEANGVNGNSTTLEYAEDDLSEGELEEYEEGDEDDPEAQWNLRKCSAATLDVLANTFGQIVFDNTLPYLRTNLTHSDWPNREAAVLALGAIAEGCGDVVEPHLLELIPFLISLLNDTQPVVRQITCWSLGRYSAWASHLPESGKQQFFLPMMDGILKRMLDKNKRVQEAAASAFANLEEKANKQLENPLYCEVIARQFAQCFSKYKDRNMFILYDCVQTLAEHVGPSLQNPKLVETLMPPILARWDKVSDHSREMFPLLECLSYVATALGTTFAPYAVPIFRRCLKIIFSNLDESLAAAQNPSLDEPDPDFLVTSLDLLSAIIQALGPSNNSDEHNSVKLVRDTQPNMFEMMVFCLENPNADVRQSAYALLGDCAIYIYPALSPWLNKIMPLLVSQLDLAQPASGGEGSPYAVTNNACWSCGEISMRARTAMSPYVETLLQRMYTILVSESVPVSLRENAAIAMGRLANSCAEMLAPHVATFAPLLLRNMKGIQATEEKVQAMQGVAEVARRNPRGLEHCFLELIGQIADISAAQYQMDKEEHDAFRKVRTASRSLLLR